jgi:glutamate 5-kinase
VTTPRRIVAKIGSQALCDESGALDGAVIDTLADEVAGLRDQGWQVLLVSSGAVAAGHGVAADAVRSLRDPVARKQVLAAAGQVRLMERWQKAFRRHGLTTAQVLLSKSDFQSRQHYLNTRTCLEGALGAGLVPVVNENDVVAVTELMFTDNDELAGLLAAMVDAERLALLSTVPGVIDPESDEPIERWDDERHTIDTVVRSGTSRLGRGGMHSKLAVARKTAGLGVTVLIADGRAPGVLSRAASDQPLGTCFRASQRATPARRWLAGMEGHALGSVTVNTGARDALLDRHRLTSLLPVGIERVEGDFHRGDVIEVRDGEGKLLGCGRASADAKEAREAMGQRGEKPLIHYDYLYLLND